MNFKNITHVNPDAADFSSLVGYTPKISLLELSKIFGDPVFYTKDEHDKITVEWVLRFPDGVATIYDYKLESTPQVDERMHFHVGGHKDAILNRVLDVIEAAHAKA